MHVFSSPDNGSTAIDNHQSDKNEIIKEAVLRSCWAACHLSRSASLEVIKMNKWG